MTNPPLTDRDLLLNLWLALVVITDEGSIDTDQCTQTLLRDGIPPAEGDPTITLSALLAEVQTRLRLTGDLDSGFLQARAN
jgi:hypothetical protein